VGVVIGLAALVVILARQVRPRPLEGNVVLLAILGIIGLAEVGAFLFGTQQFESFVKGQSRHLVLAVPHAHAMVAAAVGSLILAAVTGALRAPTIRLWRRDEQTWRQGNAFTVALWLVSLALHLGYDAAVARGRADAEFGAATLLLYLAVSLATQNFILIVRARRIRERPRSAHPRRSMT
jgi:hypothetical protein